MVLKESGEMYLETIYVLRKDKGFVRAIDVGAELGYSKPSVNEVFCFLCSLVLVFDPVFVVYFNYCSYDVVGAFYGIVID